MMSLQITPLNNVGIEVSGFDLNAPISSEIQAKLKEL